MKILAFESSCDETAVAVVEDGRRVLSDAIASQADLHALYGGVVPELASRKHVEVIAALTEKALADAGCTRQDIDAVAIPVIDAVVFQMTDAIAAGNFDKAAEVLGELLHMQEAPIKLLAVLGKQLRQLYTARLAIEHRKGVPYLMELWGMRSAYPAERLMQSARRFSLPWCRRAVLRCGQTDLAMKSTGADGEELLIGLLMELAVKKGA